MPGASQRMTANITTGDCIAGLEELPAGSVDLVIADPPYNIGIDYGDGSRADRLAEGDYIAWTGRWINAAARVLNRTGAIWVICGHEYGGDHQVAMRAAGLHWRNTVTWRESFGANCRRKFNRTSRPMYHFVRHPRLFTFNDHSLRTRSRRQELGDRRAAPGGKVLDDVWNIPRVCGTHRERVVGVPTQLPLKLVRRVIFGLTRPNDLVVDPFAGSGTTGVVCIQGGRRFHGFELRESFAEIARRRIDEAVAAAVAEGPAPACDRQLGLFARP